MELKRRQFMFVETCAALFPLVPGIAWAQSLPMRPVPPAAEALNTCVRPIGQRLGRAFIIENRLETARIDAASIIVRRGAAYFLSITIRYSLSVANVLRLICEWKRRSRSRRELRSLSLREIADFCPGLTEAEQEVRKPFWRA
jgi:uncharacterized protein YjiS (DUF1127 family)